MPSRSERPRTTAAALRKPSPRRGAHGPFRSFRWGALVLPLPLAFTLTCRSRDFGESRGVVARAWENPASVGRARTVFRYSGATAAASGEDGARPSEETCVLPKRFPGTTAPADDDRAEGELCRIDLDSHALCPGRGEVPSIDVHSAGGIPAGADPCDSPSLPATPVARFSFTVSCAWTGSVLGYAQVARALGATRAIGAVPPSVLRTMDVRRFNDVARRGFLASKRPGLAGPMWQGLATATATSGSGESLGGPDGLAGLPAPNARSFLTPDARFVFGALSIVPTRVPARADPEFAGLPRDDVARKAALLETPSFKRLFDAAPLVSTLPPAFASAAPTLQRLDDLAHGLLLDFLFQQKGRVPGATVREEWIAQAADGAVQRAPVDPASAATAPWKNALKVARLPLEANECGSRPGHAASFGITDLARLAHLNPDTYARLRYLAADPERLRSFDDEALLSTHPAPGRDVGFEGFRARLHSAVSTLEEKCRAGTLLLDLSLEDHARGPGSVAKAGQRCDTLHSAALSPPLAASGTHGPGAMHAPSGSNGVTGANEGAGSIHGIPGPNGVARERGSRAAGVPGQCVVIADRANARARAHRSADVVTQFDKGTSVTIEGRKGSWYRVVLGDGKAAYVNHKALDKPCGRR